MNYTISSFHLEVDRLVFFFRMTQTLPSLTGDLKQISECWLYRDPRVSRRARLHTFCRECKDTSTITKDDSCPLCRPFFKIPEDGCGSIPRNYFVEKLIDLHQVHLEEKLNLKGEKIMVNYFTLCYLQQRGRIFQCV